MKERTLLALTRTLCGTALLIAHAATGVDSLLTMVGLFLLGVPFELVRGKDYE